MIFSMITFITEQKRAQTLSRGNVTSLHQWHHFIVAMRGGLFAARRHICHLRVSVCRPGLWQRMWVIYAFISQSSAEEQLVNPTFLSALPRCWGDAADAPFGLECGAWTGHLRCVLDLFLFLSALSRIRHCYEKRESVAPGRICVIFVVLDFNCTCITSISVCVCLFSL